MIYAILSDIHGNLEALTVAINYIVDLGINQIICCGDIVGYGPNPSECLHFLLRYPLEVVAGNHDRAIIKDSIGIYFNEDAVIALNIQRTEMQYHDFAYLSKLPGKKELKSFAFTHSSLDMKKPYQYVVDEASIRNSLKKTRKKIVFNGHSHIPACYMVKDHDFDCLPAKHGLDIDIEDDKRYIVNVGSVGQPRDGNPELSFCLFDDVSMIIRIVRLPYPYEITQKKMMEKKFPDFLMQRLAYGI